MACASQPMLQAWLMFLTARSVSLCCAVVPCLNESFTIDIYPYLLSDQVFDVACSPCKPPSAHAGMILTITKDIQMHEHLTYVSFQLHDTVIIMMLSAATYLHGRMQIVCVSGQSGSGYTDADE